MELGEQVFHFECDPSCDAENYTIIESSIVRAKDFGGYLKAQSEQHGYAVMNDPPGPVPEIIARFGIYLHWLSDRNSHWYCCDASSSGVVGVRDGSHYNLFMYLATKPCNFVHHGMVHYWEQGVSQLAPGSYYALVNLYKELKAFKTKHLSAHPEWFRPDAASKEMSFEQVVGTKQMPGILYNITNIPNAVNRFKAEMDALEAYGLPPMPGFEKMCSTSPSDQSSSLQDLIKVKLTQYQVEYSELEFEFTN